MSQLLYVVWNYYISRSWTRFLNLFAWKHQSYVGSIIRFVCKKSIWRLPYIYGGLARWYMSPTPAIMPDWWLASVPRAPLLWVSVATHCIIKTEIDRPSWISRCLVKMPLFLKHADPGQCFVLQDVRGHSIQTPSCCLWNIASLPKQLLLGHLKHLYAPLYQRSAVFPVNSW